MNTRAKIVRLFAFTAIGFCAQPLLAAASAQQSPKFAIDSVNKHVKSHPKPKKATTTPVAAARASAPATSAKAKRDVPQIIQPVGQAGAAQPVAKRSAPAADSVPAVRRAAAAPKKKSSR